MWPYPDSSLPTLSSVRRHERYRISPLVSDTSSARTSKQLSYRKILPTPSLDLSGHYHGALGNHDDHGERPLTIKITRTDNVAIDSTE